MLTLETGPASNFQTDRSESRSTESDRENRTTEEKTVMMDRGSAYDEPAVVSTAFPVFRGALIVAEGGDDPVIRYQLSAAVAALLDLGADQITVVKMK
jgi:stage III sporulation protein AG